MEFPPVSIAGRLALGLALAALLLSSGGCRTPLAPADYHYFQAPAPEDAWSRKIRGWQRRERADVFTPAVAAEPRRVGPGGGGGLRAKFESFRAEGRRQVAGAHSAAHRRQIARDMAAWVQRQAIDHYVPDGTVDHWATLEETLRNDGDDCDGLELLTYHYLRDLDFGDEAVYRAVVYRPSDGQHHMVTLWFEDRRDPWVIDPTGAMTPGMPRMSEVPEWVPLKVFSEDRDFSVRFSGLLAANR